MDYQPKYPEYPSPGEPFTPEAATQPDSTFEVGEHNLVSLVPARPEEDDEDILISIKQAFDREHVSLQTPHDIASQLLRDYLEEHGVGDDPDDVILATLYLDRVLVVEGPWRAEVAHAMTLPQAMIANWQQQGSGEWLEHLGHPLPWRDGGYEVKEIVRLSKAERGDSDAYDALYRRTSPQTYGALTQLQVEPAAIQKLIWDAQLQGRYIEYLKQFWTQQESNYHLLLKGNVVHATLLQRDEGSLSEAHAELVLKSMMLSPATSWTGTSMRYFADNPVSQYRTISDFRVHGYVASDILVFQQPGHDHTVLYIPGNASPLHGFATAKELRDWVTHACRDPHKRAALASHFSSKDRIDGVFYSGVNRALQGLGAYPRRLDDATGLWSPASTITFGPALFPYPFSHVREVIKTRLYADANYDIGTQSDYRRKQWAYGLEVTTNVIGAIALAIPELAIVAAALGAGLVAAGAGEMIEAKNANETVEGGQRIVFGLLNALPLAGKLSQLLVAKQALEASALEAATVAEAAHKTELAAVDEILPETPGQHWPLLDEFKSERPVLDTLEADLKARLSELKVGRDVRVVGGGKGTFLDEGKLYINIRHDVYRVQWLEHEQQLRICSEQDPVSWGPFLVAQEDGYWDVQLRFGLRGGASVTQLNPEALPVQEVAGTERQPLVPRVETTLALDDIVEEADGYSARVKLPRARDGAAELEDDEHTALRPVWYDADAAAWRLYFDDLYIWREKLALRDKYRWKTGQAKDFERVRHNLPAEALFTDHRFPDLPQLPQNTAPIPRDVHMIWVGEKPLPHKIVWKIRKNLKQPGYRFIMHLDNDPVALESNRALCESMGMEVQDLQQEAFFTDFTGGADGEGYNYFRNPDSPARNYAAAADFLRYRLIDEYGAFYMDVDDELIALPEVQLQAAPHDVLLGGRYKMPWSGEKIIGNSHFASHPQNPVLKRMLQSANERFRALPESFKSTARPLEEGPALTAHMQTISAVAGPQAFNEVLNETRPDYIHLIDYLEGRSPVKSAVYDALHRETLDHYFPLRLNGPAAIMPGSAHSWIHS